MKKQFVILLIASLFLFFLERTFNLDGVKSRVYWALNPFQVGMVRVGSVIKDGVDFVTSIPFVYRENQRLQKENHYCQQVRLLNLVLREENDKLLQQSGVESLDDWKYIPVRVLGLNRGDNQIILAGNFEEGQAVVLGRSLVGQVISTQGAKSFVRSMFSSNSSVSAYINNDSGRIEGLAEGRYNNEVYLTNVLIDEKISVGDLVRTSGTTGEFPRDLLIGEVEEVMREESDIYQSARLSIPWSIKDLKLVFVLD